MTLAPVFSHPGDVILSRPGGIVLPEGNVGGKKGFSLAATVCCCSAAHAVNQTVFMFSVSSDEDNPDDDFIGFDLSAEENGLVGSWNCNSSAEENELVVSKFWQMDGEAHDYLFVAAGDLIRGFCDGERIFEKRCYMIPWRFYAHLEIGDDGKSDVIRSVINVRVYNEAVEWGDVHGRKRKDRIANAAESKLRAMWGDQQFCDAEVNCNGRVFHVHRSVLAASSPVLAAMFSNSRMKEGAERTLIIPNATWAEVEALINFMYMNETPKDCDFVGLLGLADQYEVSGLVDLCCSRLMEIFNETTSVGILRALRPRRHNLAVMRCWESLSERISADPKILRAILEEV